MKWNYSRVVAESPYPLVKIFLILACLLSAVMALTSNYNRHPDEIHHFEAAKYYVTHFLPPEIGDPSVIDSYSVYGVSYLNYHWVEYFVAGKFILLVSPVLGDDLVTARFFNVALFLGLAIFFIYRSRTDQELLIIPLFLLVTPQVWYVFGYINNDAFALAISIIAAEQIARRTSRLHRFLEADTVWKNGVGAFTFGVLLGLLLISKTNYYAFLVFVGLWLAAKFPVVTVTSRRPAVNLNLLTKFCCLAVIALLVLTFRCALDFYVNGETNFVGLSYFNYFSGGFEKKTSRLLEYQEEIAAPQYKPSTIENDLRKTDAALKLKAKGTPFTAIFTEWGWHEISFKSFVGVYGYMNIYAPKFYYRLMALLYIGFAIYVLWAALFRGRPEARMEAAILFVGIFLTLAMSSYLSWTYAFQAQGRYLFPAIPMAGVFVYANREQLNKAVLAIFLVSSFILSVYSFVFVGLARIDQ